MFAACVQDAEKGLQNEACSNQACSNEACSNEACSIASELCTRVDPAAASNYARALRCRPALMACKSSIAAGVRMKTTPGINIAIQTATGSIGRRSSKL